jgi:hypothetical protein
MLVNAADVDQMTCTILGLISNKEKTIKMVQNARILIEKMDWNIVKQDWNLLLK